jgi:hypothetical protein
LCKPYRAVLGWNGKSDWIILDCKCKMKNLKWYISLRLYGQEPVHSRTERLGEYTKHWIRWNTAGLSCVMAC